MSMASALSFAASLSLMTMVEMVSDFVRSMAPLQGRGTQQAEADQGQEQLMAATSKATQHAVVVDYLHVAHDLVLVPCQGA